MPTYNGIPRGDVSQMMAFVICAKSLYPHVFEDQKRAGSRMLIFNDAGELVKRPPSEPGKPREKYVPGPGERVVFSVKREEICHRCGYEYDPEEKRTKVCPECDEAMRKRNLPVGWSGRWDYRVTRDMHTHGVPKKPLDQAKALVGLAPARCREWNDMTGLNAIARMIVAIGPSLEYPGITDWLMGMLMSLFGKAEAEAKAEAEKPKKERIRKTSGAAQRVDLDTFSQEVYWRMEKRRKTIWRETMAAAARGMEA
jgi:hypothetical protein